MEGHSRGHSMAPLHKLKQGFSSKGLDSLGQEVLLRLLLSPEGWFQVSFA